MRVSKKVKEVNSDKILEFITSYPKDEDLVEFIKLFKDNHFDCNKLDDYGNSLLTLCANRGFVNSINILLKKGANPNIYNRFQMGPLQWAIYDGRFDMVKLLVEYNADIYKKSSSKENAIESAIKRGNTEIVNYLITFINKDENLHETLSAIKNLKKEDLFYEALEVINIKLLKSKLTNNLTLNLQKTKITKI